MTANPDQNNGEKRSVYCECITSGFVTGDTVAMEFLWPGPVPRGGQFFLVKPRRAGVFLGRPISVAGWTIRGAGETPGSILRFLITRRGRGSGEITDMRPGEEAELTGPLGNGWARAEDSGGGESSLKEGGPVALVSGGIGVAPLLAFARELEAGGRPFDFYAGFRSGSFGLEGLKPRALVIASEDGPEGLRGRIPDFFTPAGYTSVFVCGPEPMLKTVAASCISRGVPCFVSMERHMACGVGACLGCTVRTTGGNRRCCADGPVFNAMEVSFDS